LNSAAAWSLDSKTKEVVRWIGIARAGGGVGIAGHEGLSRWSDQVIVSAVL
jgi:hypothetical protein